MQAYKRGFTIVELFVIIVVIGILFAIGVVAYGQWQRNIAEKGAKSDLLMAYNLVESVHNFSGEYSSSLFDKKLNPNNSEPSFTQSDQSTVSIRTNAVNLPVYSSLSNSQKVQLFLDVCNRNMPIRSSDDPSKTYYSSCYVFLTGMLQIRLGSTDRVGHINNPLTANFSVECSKLFTGCNESDYSSVTTARMQKIKNEYMFQGGSFDITVPLLFLGAVLPEPSNDGEYEPGNKFCLEVVSKKYSDIAYHMKSSTGKSLNSGLCPTSSSDY